MSELYPGVKLLHVSLAVISFVFFLVRAGRALNHSTRLNDIRVKALPHLIDTLLLISAFLLAMISHQYPFQQTWLTVKIIALCVYILCGSFAIKRAKSFTGKVISLFLAMLTFGYMVSVALTKSPLPFG